MALSEAVPAGNSRAIGLRWLIALHLWLLAWLIFAAGTSRYCCDATYYLATSERLLQDGLYYADDYAGYRSYLVPLVIGVLRRLFNGLMVEHAYHIQYSLAVGYVVIVFLCALRITKREGLRRYFTIGFPIAFNPAVLGVVIFPMQEAVAALSCIPILMLLLCSRAPLSYSRVALALLFVVTAYLIRSSWIWLVLPIGVLLAIDWLSLRREGKSLQGRRWPVYAAALACVAMLVPQVLIAQKEFGSWNPYPVSKMATNQIVYGIDMFRYSTVIDGPRRGGLPSSTPFKDQPDKSIGFYADHPAAGAILVLGHIWAGLHYDAFIVYVPDASLGPITAPLVLSSLVTALGLLGLVSWRRGDRAVRAFLVVGVMGSCAYTALAATEARFGLWGFLCVSIAAAHLLAEKKGRLRAFLAAPVLLAYVLASIEINALLYFRAAT